MCACSTLEKQHRPHHINPKCVHVLLALLYSPWFTHVHSHTHFVQYRCRIFIFFTVLSREKCPANREILMSLVIFTPSLKTSLSFYAGTVKSFGPVPAIKIIQSHSRTQNAKSTRQNMNKCPAATLGLCPVYATFKCTKMYLKCNRTDQQPSFYVS